MNEDKNHKVDSEIESNLEKTDELVEDELSESESDEKNLESVVDGEDSKSAFDNPFINHVLFDHSNNINIDPTYWFRLRGNNQNLFIDCATPLLGMVLRARTQKSAHKNVTKLYKQCVDEIKAIEIELVEADYEYATIVAYRYILCTYIDEAIMSSSWGSQSEWTSKSLLVYFHNESWGGEKTFLIIERLEKELDRYYDLLEFALLCLSLGYEGRFKMMGTEKDRYERIITDLYDKLRRHSKWEPEPLVDPYRNICRSPYFIKQEWTVKRVVLVASICVLVFYFIYFFRLNSESLTLIEELRAIL